MQKAGTKWLYDSLAGNENFWMPPVKEFHFSDRDFLEPELRSKIDQKNLDDCRHILARGRDIGAKRDGDALSPISRRMEFARQWVNLAEGGYQIDDYTALFEPKRQQLSGDITPSYSGIRSDEIRRIKTYFPEVRIILMVREPIGRAWSAFNMFIRNRVLSAAERKAPDRQERFRRNLNLAALERFMSTSENVNRSLPTQSLDRWEQVFEAGKIHIIFFTDLVERPLEVLTDVARFLGAGGWSMASAENAKAGRMRAPIGADHLEFLRILFVDEHERLRARFPDRDDMWRK